MPGRRRTSYDPDIHSEAWLLPYADMITLLLSFFIILYAIGLENKESQNAFAESVRQAFSTTGGLQPLQYKPESYIPDLARYPQSSPAGSSMTPLASLHSRRVQPLPVRFSFRFLRGEALDILQLDHLQGCTAGSGCPLCGSGEASSRARHPFMENLQKTIARHQDLILKHELLLTVDRRGFVIRLQPDMMFDSGSAQVTPRMQEVLSDIAGLLSSLPGSSPIRVEGHTDDQPIRTFLYPSNWELSTARATTVLRRLAEENPGLTGRLQATGLADTRPIADNLTRDGRRENRRVEIIITAPEWQEPDRLVQNVSLAAVCGAAGTPLIFSF